MNEWIDGKSIVKLPFKRLVIGNMFFINFLMLTKAAFIDTNIVNSNIVNIITI